MNEHDGDFSGAEPEYGKWTKEQLIGLVTLELEKMPPRNFSEVTRIAMHYAQRTGASYPWLCKIIEDNDGSFIRGRDE